MNYSPSRLFMPRKLDPDAEVIAYLKDSALPIIIYGTGDCGRATAKYLTNKGIRNFEFAVDPLLISGSNGDATRPMTPRETDAKYSGYNLIIAIQSKLFSFCPHFNNAVKVLNLHNVYETKNMECGFISENADRIVETAEMLEDNLSCDTLFAYIKARAANNIEALCNLGVPNAYFQNDIFTLPDNTCFVDCGAFSGDTIVPFVKQCPSYSKIIAFEPSCTNSAMLRQCVKDNHFSRVEVIQKGCWNANTTLQFIDDGSEESKFSDEGISTVEVAKIDDYTANISEPMMIKMDIEGAELAALQGAERTILHAKPLLAICVYHNIEDIVTIPQYIKSLDKAYKFYLRIRVGGAYFGGIDMVLFAVSPQFEKR